ncbi:hypothetical protein GUJ93_ZPchr0011g27064 [Zizania palustris]|uniref:Uncharacterized protein n=1 Tax=Zizania palustris TaxID=103762 RepID=A0A8J5WHM6_ZIZPA|nr:hypothetical protein GUJ93_ZPchr0011g27064 [Zizania palustris]
MDKKDTSTTSQDKKDQKAQSDHNPQDDDGFEADSDGMLEDDALSKIPSCYFNSSDGKGDDDLSNVQYDIMLVGEELHVEGRGGSGQGSQIQLMMV